MTALPLLSARMRGLLPEMLADIETLVTCESPSNDLTAVAASARAVAGIGRRLLGEPGELVVVDGVTHVRWRGGAGPSKVLVLGHHDTVWPLGSLVRHPFTVRDGVLRGPGSFDMKAGVVLALYAVASLPDRSRVTVLVTGDEEIGSPTSRKLIVAEAAGCSAALVLEAAGPGGALKTARKGVSLYRLNVSGRAAHAGLEPERGINAAVELVHQILAVGRIADAELGTTVTPTLAKAGSTANTVPADASLTLDVRVTDAAEQERVDLALRALEPVLPGARLDVTGGPNRPPLPGLASAGLYRLAGTVAAGLGLPPLAAVAVGGGSDGNFTAGVGIPTLDGLGAVGGGAHAEDEHVRVSALAERAALLTGLVSAVLSQPSEPHAAPTAAGTTHP